jgi:hypothetical protein
LNTRKQGEKINDELASYGVFPLVNLAGNYISFFPKGARFPTSLHDSIKNSPENFNALRDFLVNLGRGLIG